MGKASAEIRVKRVYEPSTRADGKRFLVERLWPRGVKKEALSSVAWCREVAPSHELRKWFNHEQARWQEFQQRYRSELEAAPETWQPLMEAARHGVISLLFSARDEEHNNAVVLRAFLQEQLAKGGK